VTWSKIGLREETRRERVRALLDAGQLRSGWDFREASFIFQHGSQPDDFLMAHILAMAALAKGIRKAAGLRQPRSTDISTILARNRYLARSIDVA
jgi:xylose isomerase